MKSALVFGGSGSIGQAIVKAFKLLNYKVVVADLSIPKVDHADYYFPADVTEEQDVKRALLFVIEKYGSVEVVVSCQGVYFVEEVERTELAHLKKILDVNLKSVFLVCKHAVNYMKKQKNGGYIVNMASMAGLRGKAGESAHCASKFGVVGLTLALAKELRETKIRVSAVCPSSVDTPMLHRAVKLTKSEIERILQPDDIARVIAELVTSHPRVIRRLVEIDIEPDINKLAKKKLI